MKRERKVGRRGRVIGGEVLRKKKSERGRMWEGRGKGGEEMGRGRWKRWWVLRLSSSAGEKARCC